MSPRAAALLSVALLTGCGQKAGQNAVNRPELSKQAMPSVENATTANLPPAGAALRFVGRWAATSAQCSSKAWKFTAGALAVPGGPHCSFYKVSKAPAGYDIAAQCPAEEPVHTDLIRLRFAESAGAMLVESNAIPPTGLIYCGK